MIIKCINCNTHLPVPDVAFKYGVPKLGCPCCKTMFRPDLSETAGNKTELISPRENANPLKAWLVVRDEQTLIQTFELREGIQLIGRKSETKQCEIMIDTQDKTMSRNHFYINGVVENDTRYFEISDAGSSNQTFINMQKLNELKGQGNCRLKDGDVIQAGKTEIVFREKITKTENDNQATVLITRTPQAGTT